MRKKIILAAVLACGTALLAGCGGEKSYADGTYEAESDVYVNDEEDDIDEDNGYGVVTLIIKDGAISECEFVTYTIDGEVKDEDYGKKSGEISQKDYYNKAQKAVAACGEYAAALVEAGSLDGVDSISGATINYDEFKQAVKAALKEAETGE